ncbi:MAG: hypothetical protein RLZZ182_2272 [Pseudomonadota bacterium]|jgi:hypothetical protein
MNEPSDKHGEGDGLYGMEPSDVRLCPLIPTAKMRTDGARRLLRFEDDLSDTAHDALQWAGARNDAERVWRSMWLAAEAARPPTVAQCQHEAYQGRCVHCDVAFKDGAPVSHVAATGETPRTDEYYAEYLPAKNPMGRYHDDSKDDCIAFARQLERDLAEARKLYDASLMKEAAALEQLDEARRSATGDRLQAELLDERFTGKYIEDFVDRWAEGKAASDQSAFTEADIQRLLDFAVDLTHGLTGEDFNEFVARVPYATADGTAKP